jgi:hypothetical protein
VSYLFWIQGAGWLIAVAVWQFGYRRGFKHGARKQWDLFKEIGRN